MTAVLLLTSAFTPHASAASKFKVLYSFKGRHAKDGGFPLAGLTFDAAGNLYGTTLRGGVYDGGTAFELNPNGKGGWTESVLHGGFNCVIQYGCQPAAGLVVDTAGNLYGTTGGGGTMAREQFSG